MKTRSAQILGRLLWLREVSGQQSGNGVAVRHWMARLALPLLAVVCLSPMLVAAGDNQTSGVAQTSPSSGTISSPASTNSDAGAKPGILFSNEMMNALDDKQKLAVGDTVIFRVLEDREDAKSLTVTDAGELDVPELGLVSAAGKTCRQLAFEIKSKLERTTYYHATVMLGIQQLNKTMSGRRVYLAGEVLRPGPQEIPAGETWTVSKAILSAGGFTQYADKKKVRLVRSASGSAPAKTVVLNLVDILEKGHTEQDLPVEAEDLIYVPARAINF